MREQAELVQEIAREHGGRASSGRPEPRTAPASGRRATWPTSPACSSCPARAPCRPTSACRSRASPSASSRPPPTSRTASMPIPMFGHVGDGNFHCMILIDPDEPSATWRRRRRSTTAWSTARWRWKAPAPASTASARARSSRCRRSTATAVELMVAHQAHLRSGQPHEPRQGGSARSVSGRRGQRRGGDSTSRPSRCAEVEVAQEAHAEQHAGAFHALARDRRHVGELDAAKAHAAQAGLVGDLRAVGASAPSPPRRARGRGASPATSAARRSSAPVSTRNVTRSPLIAPSAT